MEGNGLTAAMRDKTDESEVTVFQSFVTRAAEIQGQLSEDLSRRPILEGSTTRSDLYPCDTGFVEESTTKKLPKTNNPSRQSPLDQTTDSWHGIRKLGNGE